jgi:hypothetical protein
MILCSSPSQVGIDHFIFSSFHLHRAPPAHVHLQKDHIHESTQILFSDSCLCPGIQQHFRHRTDYLHVHPVRSSWKSTEADLITATSPLGRFHATPGATSTDGNGINAVGIIVGDFFDSAGVKHGYVAMQ